MKSASAGGLGDADHPPYVEDRLETPRAGHGGFQHFLFFDVDAERSQERFGEKAQRKSRAMRAEGVTPTYSIMHWSSAYADARPGSGKSNADSPAHRAWFDWLNQREDYFWVGEDGRHLGADKTPAGRGLATAYGRVPPSRPLNVDDPDRDEAAGVLNYGY